MMPLSVGFILRMRQRPVNEGLLRCTVEHTKAGAGWLRLRGLGWPLSFDSNRDLLAGVRWATCDLKFPLQLGGGEGHPHAVGSLDLG